MRLFDWLNRWSTSTRIARRKARRRNSQYHCQIAVVTTIEPLERREVLTSIVSLMSGGGALAEGNMGPSASQFFVMVMPMSPTPILVNYSIPVGAVNAADFFGPMSGSMTIPPNTPGQGLPVRVNGDLDVELDELYALNITASGAILGMSSLTGTLLNDDIGMPMPPMPPPLPPPMPPMPPMNTPPTISTTESLVQTTNEDTPLGPLTFSVADAETPVTNLTVSRDPSILFPGITFVDLGGGNWTFTVTPFPNMSGTGNLVLKVTDGGGASATLTFQVTVNAVNDAPTITNATNRTNAEGDMVMWTPTVDDPDIGDTWKITNVVGLPSGLSRNATWTGITGRIHYDALASYNVTVTVQDIAGTGLSDTKNFIWNIQDRSIGTLTGTEAEGTNDLGNSVTVAGLTMDELWVSQMNYVHLTVAAPVGGTLPIASDIRYFIGAVVGTIPTGGSFTSSFADNDVVSVGVDTNCNTKLDAGEVTHSFRLRRVSFVGANIKTARISTTTGPDPDALDEAFFKVNLGEIYDTASTFQIQLNGGSIGPATIIRPQVLYGTTPAGGLSANSGTTVDWTPSGNVNDAMIRFYVDANNSGTCDPMELKLETFTFKVKPLNPLAFTFDISDQIPAFQIMSISQRQEAIQTATNVGVTRMRVKNSQDDFRAAVTITMTARTTISGSEIFAANVGGALPDAADDDAKRELHYVDMPDNNIRFLNNLGTRRGEQSGNKILVSWTMMAPDTIVHEIGHILLGPAHTSDPMNIMCAGDGPPPRDPLANKLDLTQANYFTGL